jgi:hypothetical protein
MDHHQIIEFWGSASPKRSPRANVADVVIPESSKTFLVTVGLPTNVGWTLRFDDDGTLLPRLSTTRLRRFGYDDVVPLCLDELAHAAVLADESGVGGTTRFINSSVERFGECLVHYQTYRMKVRGLAESEARNLIRDTGQHLRNADAIALEDGHNWWSVILEQIRD